MSGCARPAYAARLWLRWRRMARISAAAAGAIGTARGKLLWFRERPLSPAEGAAMQK